MSLFHEKGCPQTHTKEKVAPVDPAPPVEAKRRSRYRGPVAPADGTVVASENGTRVAQVDGTWVQPKQNKWKNL